MIPLEVAKTLSYHQVIYSTHYRNSDGTAQRWRVISAVKTWKKDSNRIEVSIKRGLYEFDRIDADDLLCDFSLTDEISGQGVITHP